MFRLKSGAGPTLWADDPFVDSHELARWCEEGLVFVFKDDTGCDRYLVEQFVAGRPLPGIKEISGLISDPRVAWSWLRRPHVVMDGGRPIDLLERGDIRQVQNLVQRDFL